MAHALELIASGRPVAAVLKETGIPHATLMYKSSGKSPSAKEETFFVHWIMFIQQRYFAITKIMLLDSVEKLIIQTKSQKNPFKNNRQSDKWFKSFLQIYPEILPRIVQNLAPARKNVTKRQIRNWFDEVRVSEFI